MLVLFCDLYLNKKHSTQVTCKYKQNVQNSKKENGRGGMGSNARNACREVCTVGADEGSLSRWGCTREQEGWRGGLVWASWDRAPVATGWSRWVGDWEGPGFSASPCGLATMPALWEPGRPSVVLEASMLGYPRPSPHWSGEEDGGFP